MFSVNMPFTRIPRRKRWTVLKVFLIIFSVSGVMFWFNQLWSVTISSTDHKNLQDHQDSAVFPKDPFELKNLHRDSLSDTKPAKPQKQQKPWSNKIHGKRTEYSKKELVQIASPNRLSDDDASNKRISMPPFRDKFMKVTPGLGENGIAVVLSDEEQKVADEEFVSAAFNVYISDRIALNRSVPDPRNPLCKYEQYDHDLPSASVVIIFTNEVWSALLRTVYSVINRTPSRLLHEIILVDDFSDKEYLKSDLEQYLQSNFPPKLVKLLRLEQRQGLIRARLAGARMATGDVLVFLDSHCETNEKWLEPLLQRIKQNRKTVLCPIIDVIDDKTLEYYANNKDYFQIGGFTWSGHFTWIEVPKWEKKKLKDSISPTKSPTMAGGLFAVERDYFWEIGSYDPGMDIWGGENLEMSFRIWQCGGSLEIIPCSHVGHIFRSFHPYVFPGNKDTHGINTVRTVEVWLDEYKKYFYMYRQDLKHVDYGDITERLNFKMRMNCKPFSWYLKNIYPEKFILDVNVSAYGIVRNPISRLCLDILNRDEDKVEPLGYYHCKTQENIVMNQMFSLSNEGELRREENCAEVSDETTKSWLPVVMTKCHGKGREQEWTHNMGGPIIHIRSGKCLDSARKSSGEDAYVTDCNGSHTQIWWFENYKEPSLDVRHKP